MTRLLIDEKNSFLYLDFTRHRKLQRVLEQLGEIA